MVAALAVVSIFSARCPLEGLDLPAATRSAADGIDGVIQRQRLYEQQWNQSQAEINRLRIQLRDLQQKQNQFWNGTEKQKQKKDASKSPPGSSATDARDLDMTILRNLWRSMLWESQLAESPLSSSSATTSYVIQEQERRSHSRIRRRILVDWKTAHHRSVMMDEAEVTTTIVLVTHASTSKLDILQVQLQYWGGPASVALYVASLEDIARLETFLQNQQTNPWFQEHVALHMVLENFFVQNEEKETIGYPHNWLRNVALDYAGSDYVVVLDVDFIPGPPGCYARLQTLLREPKSQLQYELRQQRRLLVLPAFEVYVTRTNQTSAAPDQLPSSKVELAAMVRNQTVEAFHVERFYRGHGPTDYTRWFHDDIYEKSNELFYKILYEPNYEPYILAYRPGLPRYWTKFRGYGQNKMSWFRELHRAGYRFGVLRECYVTHLQHPPTSDKQGRRANAPRGNEFVDYLHEQYPLDATTGYRIERQDGDHPVQQGNSRAVYYSFEDFRKGRQSATHKIGK